MNSDFLENTIDEAWSGGFVCGLLTARYYHLRYSSADGFFQRGAPTDAPDVIYALMASMCRGAIDRRLFETSWDSLDHLLLCNNKDELQSALGAIPDHRLQ